MPPELPGFWASAGWKRSEPLRRSRRPRHGISVAPAVILLPILWIIVPGRGEAANSALIPREDNRWDPAIRRAVDLIRRNELSRGIQILQDIVEDAPSRRSLRSVPEDFGPAFLLSSQKAADPLADAGPEAGARAEDAAAGPDVFADESPRASARSIEDLRKACHLYLPVAEVARQLLAGLSPEGVSEYRKIYDPLAEASLRAALETRDMDILRRVAEDDPLSSAGIPARDRLAERHFEEGRFWSALLLWESLLADRTEPEVSSSEIELKCLAALRLLGEEEEYEKARKVFHSHLRSQAGSDGLAGAYETLLSWLSAFEAAYPIRKRGAGDSIAPGMGPLPLPHLPGARLTLDWASSFWSERSNFSGTNFRGLSSGRVFPFFPLFQEDSIYLNGIFRLQRLSAASGRVSRIYAKPLPNRDLLHFEERSDSPVYCVSLAPLGGDAEVPGPAQVAGGAADPGPPQVVLTSFLSARVKSQSFRGYEIYAEIPTRSLAAIETVSGRLLWQTGDLAFGQAGRPVSFTTPALVNGRRAIAGGWQQVGYINSVLVAFDLLTGEVLWHQLLAADQLELTMFGEMGREPFAAVLAEREGVVYCVTNLGAVAAVDAVTGNILWLATYPTIEVEPGEGQRSPIREILWGVNPPLFLGETLIVTPRDCAHLLAIDIGPAAGRSRSRRQPGRVLWSYSNEGHELRDLLGHAGGLLYFTGPAGVQALDIRDIPPGGNPKRVLSTIHWTEKGVEGRGALTDAGVVVAAEGQGLMEGIEGVQGAAARGDSRLWVVDLSLKKRTALTGLLSRMGLPEAAGLPRSTPPAGNVSVHEGRIFLTSRDSIAAFSPVAPAGAGTEGAAPPQPSSRAKGGRKREDL